MNGGWMTMPFRCGVSRRTCANSIPGRLVIRSRTCRAVRTAVRAQRPRAVPIGASLPPIRFSRPQTANCDLARAAASVPLIRPPSIRAWVPREFGAVILLQFPEATQYGFGRQCSAGLDKLKDLILTYPLAYYVVSSRPQALKTDKWLEWQEWTVANHFTDVTLQEMDEPQVDRFVHNWFRALKNTLSNPDDEDGLQHYPDDLVLLLRNQLSLRRLAANPLLCAMLCALFHDRRESLPSDRIAL